jgi:hypothetical protein
VKARAPISDNVSEPDSTVNSESEEHPEKHHPPRTFTRPGKQIDFREEQSENALPSIRVNNDPDSNVKEESEEHDLKQSMPRMVTDAGRQIDCREEQSKKAEC